jgi:hypothetical protein
MEQMASMRNGEGDSWFCVFSPFGAFVKGCDYESQMSPRNNGTGKTWPGILDDVPDVFRSFLSEPAFSMEDTTFCIWRTYADVAWRNGNVSNPVGMDPDGSAHLLSIFDGNPQTYSQWAEEYYTRLVSVVLVEHLYSHKPLTESVVRELNPRATSRNHRTTFSKLATHLWPINWRAGWRHNCELSVILQPPSTDRPAAVQ